MEINRRPASPIVIAVLDHRRAPTGLAELANLPQNGWGRLDPLDHGNRDDR